MPLPPVRVRIALAVLVVSCVLYFVVRGTLPTADTLTLYGNVDIRQVELAFRVGGRMDHVAVDEGDAVQAGQLLARLDAQPLEDALRRATAELAMQQAELDKMRLGYRPEDVEQARAALSGQESTLMLARQSLDRVSRLYAQRAVAQKELDSAQANAREAVARVDAAREQLRLMRSGYRAEDINRQQAAVDAAQAAVDAARTNVADTSLYAPQEGIVLTRVREQGAVVQGGQTVLTLTLNTPTWVRAFVTQPQLGNIHPGQPVLLQIDATPGVTYRGTVGFISPAAEFTPKTVETKEIRNDLVFRFRVLVENPGQVMRQGMPVTLTLRKDGGTP
ncbi:MAG: efflux RND transporter periplasmic adaptor subunit [Desulfovibrionaceae bacterium]